MSNREQSIQQSAQSSMEIILLAAGRSRRMGATDKLLLPVGGEPMLRRSARLYCELGLPVIVVTGRADGPVTEALGGLGLRLAINPDPDQGQHSSVYAGLEAAALNGSGVAIALADQPLLTATDIRTLIACFEANREQAICIPRHAGKRGNPVILPASVARSLRDDPRRPPPRAYIDSHPGEIVWFEADSDHFTADVDTPADAVRLLGAAVLG